MAKERALTPEVSAQESSAACSHTTRRSVRLQQLRILQERQPLLARFRKFRPVPFGNRIGRRQPKPFKILVLPALQNPEIEVRPRGKARASHQPNRFADFHALARAHKHPRKMQVHRLVSVRMSDLHHVSFAAFTYLEPNSAASDRLNRSSNRRSVIRSHVRTVRF